MSLPPCKECPDRFPGCHSQCPKYLAWRKEYDKEKEQERQQKQLYNSTNPIRRNKWKNRQY